MTARTIRVFVSSTFRDMQEEREELVKRVFPALRHQCEQRGVSWGEVDLRWGVTDEQKAEGAVLPICLAEIERSRPYFIGLLGERYGWVPDEIPADLAEREGWLAEHADRSVTELEILHGVLNQPEMAGHAFFYLRDPAWTADKPEFVEDDEHRRRQLADLKARLRTSGFPVADYADPVALGALVGRDLAALVDRLFPESAAPDPLTQAREEQESYTQARFAGYVSRPAYEGELDRWAAGTGGPLVVTGQPGSGKSALLAAWVLRRREPAVVHFVGASAASTDWQTTVRRLFGELARLAGHEPEEPPADPQALRVACAARLLAAGPMTLVIDGLDQLADGEGARELAWLPVELPPAVRLVVSTLSGVSLDETRRRRWTELSVGALDEPERRQLAEDFLGRFSKRLGREQLDRLASAPAAGSPLFLRAVLDELRQWGDHFTLDARIDFYLAAATVDDLYERILARWEGDFERDRPGLVADLFRSLWAARFGLSEVELGDLLGVPRAVWSPLYLAAEQSLVSRSGLLGFFHQALRTAVADRYHPGPADHGRLAAYFAAQPAGPRPAAERAWQHAEAGDWDGMQAALADLDLLDIAYRRDFLDVRALWLRLAAARPGAALAAFAPLIADPTSNPGGAWQAARLLSDLGHPAEALTLHRFLVAHHRAAGDERTLAAALNNLAATRRQAGDLDGALAALVEQEAIASRLGITATVIASLQNQAGIRRDRDEHDAALAVLARLEAMCREAGALADLGACLGLEAGVLDDRGDVTGALAKFEEQERVCRQAADPIGLAYGLGGQAKVWSDRGDPIRAAELYRQQEEIARRIGDLTVLLYCLANQAGSKLVGGDAAGAAPLLAEAEALAARLGDATGAAQVVKLRAIEARARGDQDAVLRLAADLAARYAALGDVGGQLDAMQLQATALIQRGDPTSALAVSRQQEQIARQHGLAAPLQVAVGDQGLALQQLGDLDGALARYQEQERLARESNAVHGIQASLGNQATVLAARGDAPGALALLQQQSQLCLSAGLVAEVQQAYSNRLQIHFATGDVQGALMALAEMEEGGRRLGPSGAGILRAALAERGALVMNTGQPAAALPLLAEAEQLARAAGDGPRLAQVLLNKGMALLATGSVDQAWAAMQEQEALSRSLGDWHGLQGCLGNQAIVLQQRGDIAGALVKTEEQERICRQTGDSAALVIALANKGELTASQPGRKPEGIALLQEAAALAQQLGQHPMVQQIQALIQQIQTRP